MNLVPRKLDLKQKKVNKVEVRDMEEPETMISHKIVLQ
jgi:hypothetical protein